MSALRFVPEPLHRIAYRIAHALRTRWWRISHPRLNGCRALALDAGGRVLLVRHSYGSSKWMLPGGGVKRGEDPVAAAVRELAEETGCRLAAVRLIAVLEEPLHGATNVVHLVGGETEDLPVVDGREIVEARFFSVQALPADMAPSLQAGLADWLAAFRTL